MEEYNYKMKLSELIPDAPSMCIETLFSDSRKKVVNGMFFCIKGLTSDGHKYVNQAIRNGAVAIVHSDELEQYRDDIFYIKVDNVLKELNYLSTVFYRHPTKDLTTYAVTGTNGKSTVSNTLYHIINRYEACGYVGTISIEYADVFIEPDHTTPDIVELNQTLADMRDKGITSLAIETSSHGLAQHRVDSLDVQVAIFTNLTHEHLDYHGTMEEYFQAKALLFEKLDSQSTAIINIDDEYGRRLLNHTQANIVTYALDQEATYRASNIIYDSTHTEFTLTYNQKNYEVTTNMLAKFNVYNLLSVIAALHQQGYPLEQIIKDLKNLEQVVGRMEVIDEGQDFTVIVDYAHTPDGFEKLFEYAEKIKGNKRIISVFGSAGKRDLAKRPILGEIANRYSDMIILTEDDPRNESVESICEEIAEGITDTNYIIIERRYDAIYQAISQANSGDIILLMGKGDDLYMAREEGREPWYGDEKIARWAIKEYYGGETNEEE